MKRFLLAVIAIVFISVGYSQAPPDDDVGQDVKTELVTNLSDYVIIEGQSLEITSQIKVSYPLVIVNNAVIDTPDFINLYTESAMKPPSIRDGYWTTCYYDPSGELLLELKTKPDFEPEPDIQKALRAYLPDVPIVQRI